MELKKLLEGISFEALQGNQNIIINKPEYDSRKIVAGDVFVCITGFQADGHKFAKKAVENGAVALICEHMQSLLKRCI